MRNGHAGGFEPPSPYRYEPKDMASALQFAKAVVASGFAPNVRTIETAFVILATGAELGLSAMQSIRSIHIIDGKPSLSADLIVGLVKRSPVCEWFRMVENSPTRAVYETQRRGEPEPTRFEYTIEDAQHAGLAKRRNWRLHPAAMLRARAASALSRAVYPDLLAGISLPDEDGEPDEVEVGGALEVVDDPGEAPRRPAPKGEGFATLDSFDAAVSKEEGEEPSEASPADVLAERVREIDHFDTRDAARYVARQLVSLGVASDPAAAMKELVSAVEALGVVPSEAAVEDIARAWLAVEPEPAPAPQ